MTELTKENYNDVLFHFDRLMIFGYDAEDGMTDLIRQTLMRIDRMIGLNFKICTVNLNKESAIKDVLSIKVSDTPIVISIIDQKVFKRLKGDACLSHHLEKDLLDLMK